MHILRLARAACRPPVRGLGLTCVALSLIAPVAVGGQLDFTYVTTWPRADGETIAHQTWRDQTSRLNVTRIIREARAAGEVRRVHLVLTACGPLLTGDGTAGRQPFIVAVRRWPAMPADASAAEQRARFVRVHVREPGTGRIRLYRDLWPIELTQLTRALLPYCVPA